MKQILSLSEAESAIKERISITGAEHVALHDALGRVAATPLYALHPLPSYSQALYDGVVISKIPAWKEGRRLIYTLMGEIAAGDIRNRRCTTGQAYRIMTGAQIPTAGWQVVPQESLVIEGQQVIVEVAALEGAGAYIRKKGGECRTGTRLVAIGDSLTPSDIGRLADTGHDDVLVRRPPVVAYCCTGSELVGNSADSGDGLKVSSNRYLLGGMVRLHGSTAQDWGSVDDKRRSFSGRLNRMQKQEPDIIITTGGMGPGKYDLVEELFLKMGGEIIFTGVGLRPGKSVLFGSLGNVLFFGLPGPPSAVKALFQVLVRPAILQMQGIGMSPSSFIPLGRDVVLRKSSIPRVLEGVFIGEEGRNGVRFTEKLEKSECYILCPAGRRHLKKGARVRVYGDAPPAWLGRGSYQRF